MKPTNQSQLDRYHMYLACLLACLLLLYLLGSQKPLLLSFLWKFNRGWKSPVKPIDWRVPCDTLSCGVFSEAIWLHHEGICSHTLIISKQASKQDTYDIYPIVIDWWASFQYIIKIHMYIKGPGELQKDINCCAMENWQHERTDLLQQNFQESFQRRG